MKDKVFKKEWRTTKEITLPTTGVTVECYSSLLVADVKDIDYKENEIKIGMDTLVKLIKSWNYYASEKDEKPLEINLETFNTLPVKDLEFLLKEVTELSAQVKKN